MPSFEFLAMVFAAGGAILLYVSAIHANRRIAEAELQTERLKAQNLALEAQISPRRLNETEEKEITSFLQPYTGRKIIVASYAFDVEGTLLATQIRDIVFGNRLLSVVNEIGAHIPARAPVIQGIYISGNDDQLISALEYALHSLGKLQLASSATGAG
jgi:hypothetical protein